MGKNGSFQRVEMKVRSNKKVVFFIRVFAFHAYGYDKFVNKHYEEVLLNNEVQAI